MRRTIPHILMITHGLGLEGAPRSFVIVAKGLAASGAGRVTVFSHADGPLRKELESVGIRVMVAPAPDITRELPDTVTGLERYCRENMRFLDLSSMAAWKDSLNAVSGHIHRIFADVPDIILTNTILGFWGVALARLWNVPSVWCIHESEPPFSHLAWLPQELFAILPGLLAHTSQVIFVARATQDVFIQAGHTFSGTIIPLGLPPDMPVFTAARMDRDQARISLHVARKTVCFLALGSVFERKGQTDLCRAMALLPEKLLENMRCHIVGDRPGTPYSDILHSCIDGLPSHARRAIRIFPETPDTAPHYRAADAFVLCSRMESYPFVILEAMSLGLPIITTPVFGVREQLTEDAALFYEPGDVEMLAYNIFRLSEESTTRTVLGHEARKCFSQLPTHADMIADYHTLIRNILFRYT